MEAEGQVLGAARPSFRLFHPDKRTRSTSTMWGTVKAARPMNMILTSRSSTRTLPNRDHTAATRPRTSSIGTKPAAHSTRFRMSEA